MELERLKMGGTHEMWNCGTGIYDQALPCFFLPAFSFLPFPSCLFDLTAGL